jgi:hypothetical protein
MSSQVHLLGIQLNIQQHFPLTLHQPMTLTHPLVHHYHPLEKMRMLVHHYMLQQIEHCSHSRLFSSAKNINFKVIICQSHPNFMDAVLRSEQVNQQQQDLTIHEIY